MQRSQSELGRKMRFCFLVWRKGKGANRRESVLELRKERCTVPMRIFGSPWQYLCSLHTPGLGLRFQRENPG